MTFREHCPIARFNGTDDRALPRVWINSSDHLFPDQLSDSSGSGLDIKELRITLNLGQDFVIKMAINDHIIVSWGRA